VVRHVVRGRRWALYPGHHTVVGRGWAASPGRLGGDRVVQLWAGNVDLDEANRYDGELSLLQTYGDQGPRVLMVLGADPRVRVTFELIESLGVAELKLLDVVNILDEHDNKVIYVVRGIDLESGYYFLAWPD
jgi:hypothetical protein